MGNYQYYNYEDTGKNLTNIPANTHLIIELDSDNFYFVKITTQIELYLFTISTGVEVQIDIDPSNSSGDQKSRDHKIQALWHDKTNSIIYGVDCDNDGTADDYDVWKLDYTSSKNTPSVTEIGTLSGADANTVYINDIFMISTNVYVVSSYKISGINYLVCHDVDTAPFTLKDTFTPVSGVTAEKGWQGVVVDDNIFYYVYYSPDDSLGKVCKYTASTTTITEFINASCDDLPSDHQRGIAYDEDDNLYLISRYGDPAKNLLNRISITGDSTTRLSELDVALMLDRNVHGTTPPFTLEKAFHMTLDRIFQIPPNYLGYLNMISTFDFDDTIVGITDHFVIDNSGNIYKMVDLFDEYAFTYAFLDYWKEDYPRLELEYNSNKLSLTKNMFLQIIGILSKDGSSTPNSVIFEGVVDKVSGTRLQKALVINEGKEIDDAEPTGEFTGDTDGAISEIISSVFDYITEGTLQDGADLGTIIWKGNKKALKEINQLKDLDGYSWALQPQGALDYDDGSVDSGVDLLYETGVNTDPIWEVDTVPLSYKANQVIVIGALNSTTGVPYSDQWDDEADQQLFGIQSIVIIDAKLNSDALCLAKATAIGNRESANPLSVQCKFRKISAGVIYPHQTITFKYISEDVSISQAQYIVDGVGLDLITEECYLQISTGLFFGYNPIERELPEENSQKIDQMAADIIASEYVDAAGAVAAVEAAGLALDDGKVITSQLTDLTFLLGRIQLSSIVAAQAFFGYRGHTDVQYAIKQTTTFGTYLNAATGKLISHRINNVDKMVMSASALTMSIPIAMGTNKITGLGDPVDAQDAATKTYSDLHLLLSGGTMAGDINMGGHSITSSGAINIIPSGESNDYWIISAASNNCCLYHKDATTSTEVGYIGYDIVGSVAAPLAGVYAYNFYKDAIGAYGNYDIADDLDLLRNCHNSSENKIKPIDGIDYEITAYEMRTLPWLVAIPEIDKLSDEELRYAGDIAQPIGYLLSTLQKLLERQDKIIKQLNLKI